MAFISFGTSGGTRTLDHRMEQQALKSVKTCLNTNIYSYLETSGANVMKRFTAVSYAFS
jgi:hypothetical protein